MPIKKSELYSSLWKSCDELRGGMDASQYKDYVLVLLFVKYVSDKAASQKNYLLDVPAGGSFADMVPLAEISDPKNDYNLNLPRYIDSSEPEDIQDIEGHLKGGVPDRDMADERKLLTEYLALVEREAAMSAKVKQAQDALTAKYGKLTDDEIKTLVVDDKWLAAVAAAVQGELDRVSQTLTERIREPAERYARPLPDLIGEVATLSARVDAHLAKMGFAR